MLKKWMQLLHKLNCAIVLHTSTVGLCSSMSWSYFVVGMAGTMWGSAKVACAIWTETGHWEWQCDKEKLMTFQSKVWFWHNSMAHIASCAMEPMHCNSWTSSLHDVGVFFMRFKILTMFSVGFVCFMGWQSQVGSWLCSQVSCQICGDGSQTLFYLSQFLPRETCHSQLLRGLLQGWIQYLFLMLHGIPLYLPVHTLYFWEHLTTLSHTPSVPIPVSSQRNMLLSVDAWSSTGTLSSLPDAQWNATVPPVRLKFAIGKLSQPKCCHHNIHLFNKEQQFLSKQIQLIAAATQHGKNHRGFQGLTHLLQPIFLGLGKVVEESHLIP